MTVIVVGDFMASGLSEGLTAAYAQERLLAVTAFSATKAKASARHETE